MAVNATVLQIVQPGATGNVTYSLPANFDPKAIIVFSGSVSATGLRAMVSQNIGFGTYRGGVVQQAWNAITDEDANATAANTYGRTGTDAIAKFGQSTSNTILAAVSLVSMQTGATSQIVLNWSVRTATFTPGLTVLVLGGSDITDAMVGTSTNTAAATTQSFTVASGFGQPDCLFVAKGGDTSAATTTTLGGQSPYNFGFGKKAAGGRHAYFYSLDGAATQDVRTRFGTSKILYGGVTGTLQIDAALAAAGSWPTDGFAIAYATATAAWPFSWLALRTSANAMIEVGGTAARTTTGTTTVTPAAGSAKAAIVVGQRTLTADAEVTSSSDLGFTTYGMCAADGTQGVRGLLDQDNAATSVTDDTYNSAATVEFYSPTTEAVTSRATGTCASGSLALNWTTAEPTNAYLLHYLMIGEAASITNVNADVVGYTMTTLDGQSSVMTQEAAIVELLAAQDINASVSVATAAPVAALSVPGTDTAISGTGTADVCTMSIGALDASPGVGATQQAVCTTSVVTQDATVSAVPLPTPDVVLALGTDRQNQFKLQYVQHPDTGSTYEADLATLRGGYSNANFFTTYDPTIALPVVAFKVYADGTVTSGDSGGPRVELREVKADGVTQQAFDAMTGEHSMRLRVAVIHSPAAAPAVVYAQLHNGVIGDRISFRLQLTSSLVKNLARINGTQAIRFSESYPYGTYYDLEMRVTNGGVVSILLANTVVATGQLVTTGSASWYFKAGAYLQSNESTAGVGEYAEVWMRELAVTHNFGTNVDAQQGGLSIVSCDVTAYTGVAPDQAAAAGPALDPSPGVGASPSTAWHSSSSTDPSESADVAPNAATTGLGAQDLQAVVMPNVDLPWWTIAPDDAAAATAPGGVTAAATSTAAQDVSAGAAPAGVTAAPTSTAAADAAATTATSATPTAAPGSAPAADTQSAVTATTDAAPTALAGADPSAAPSVNTDAAPTANEVFDGNAVGANESIVQPTVADVAPVAADLSYGIGQTASVAPAAPVAQSVQAAVSASAVQSAAAAPAQDATATRADTTQGYPAQADTVHTAADTLSAESVQADATTVAGTGNNADVARAANPEPVVAAWDIDSKEAQQVVVPTVYPAIVPIDGIDAGFALSQGITPGVASPIVDGADTGVATSTAVPAISASGAASVGDAAAGVAAGPGAGAVAAAAPAATPGTGAAPGSGSMDMDATPGDRPVPHPSVGVAPGTGETVHTVYDAGPDAEGSTYAAPDPGDVVATAADVAAAVAPVARQADETVAGGPLSAAVTAAPGAGSVSPDAQPPGGSGTTSPGTAGADVVGSNPDLYVTGEKSPEADAAEFSNSVYPPDLSISPVVIPITAAPTVAGAPARTTGSSSPAPAAADVSADGSTPGVTPTAAGAAAVNVAGASATGQARAVAEPVPDPAALDAPALPSTVAAATLAIAASANVSALDVIAARAREAVAVVAGAIADARPAGAAVAPFAVHALMVIAVADALGRVPAIRGTLSETYTPGARLDETWRAHGLMGETVRATMIEWARSAGSIAERDRG